MLAPGRRQSADCLDEAASCPQLNWGFPLPRPLLNWGRDARIKNGFFMTTRTTSSALQKVALFSLLLAIAWPQMVQAQAPGAQAPTPVIVAPAVRGDFVDRIEALGTTRANESVQVTASVTEIVQEILFDDGQTVETGDVLVILEKAEEEADLRAADAVVTERRLAFQRAQELESRQFTATAQLDERRAALLEAEAEVEAVKARIDKRIIRAPFSGVVGIRDISPGALVEPGDLVTTLDDLSVIKLDFAVPAVYLATLTPGLPIVAEAAAFGGQAFDGEISSIGSRVDPVTRSITARALIDNPDGALRPGLLMTVELLKDARQTIVIPEEALIPVGRQTYVLVVDPENNTAVRKEVEIGARRPGAIEILSGLDEGELVVTHGTARVTPGQPVTVQAIENGNESLSQMLQRAPDG